jgi:hypothetical protein
MEFEMKFEMKMERRNSEGSWGKQVGRITKFASHFEKDCDG